MLVCIYLCLQNSNGPRAHQEHDGLQEDRQPSIASDHIKKQAHWS